MSAKASRGPTGYPETLTYRAEGGALTRGYAVMQGTDDDQCKAPTGSGVRGLGIVTNDDGVAEGGLATICVEGECVAIAKEALAPQDAVKVDASGKLSKSAAEDAEILGIARTTAAADGDEFILDVGIQVKRS